MTRPIKFRGLDYGTEEWVYGDLLRDDGLWCISRPNETKIYERVQISIMDETIGQFTGLLDRNGKEIYESDIIKASNLFDDQAVVEWRSKYCGFALVGNSSIDPLLPHLHPDIEVIGNKWENPELLMV